MDIDKSYDILYFDESLREVVKYLLSQGIGFNYDGGFMLPDANDANIGEAELGIGEEKNVFLPFISQSETAFRNYEYSIEDSEGYFKLRV